MAGLKVTPLSSVLGARVEGLDLARDAQENAEQLRELLWRHMVVVFPNQPLGEAEQQALLSVFGPLQPHPVLARFGDDRTVFFVGEDQVRPLEDGTSGTSYQTEFDEWHSDYTFASSLPAVASLRAEVLPETGGDTTWANMALAFDRLSGRMQEILRGMTATHWFGELFVQNFPFADRGEGALEKFRDDFKPVRHPVVVEHQPTGRPALFVNPVYTVRIDQLSPRESDAILRFLFSHMTAAPLLYKHRWSRDDLVIWDEQLTTHLAPSGVRGPRRLVRVVAGSVQPKPWQG